ISSAGRGHGSPTPAPTTCVRRRANRSDSASSKTNGIASCGKCAVRRSSSSAAKASSPVLPPKPRPTTTEVHTPRLALVPGEPAGVGPELCVRLAQQPRRDHTLVAFGDAESLHRAAEALRLPLRTCAPGTDDADAPGSLALVEHPSARRAQFGRPDPANAHAVIAALRDAASRCLAGACSGLVTGPVNKAVINNGGIEY